MEIELRAVTRENWEQCISLKVAPDQARFVAPNLYSLAQSKFEPWCTPLGVYHGDTMVGFVMYGKDPDIDPARGAYLIYRLMIAAPHQGKGYGRHAMKAVMQRLREQHPDCREVLLGFEPENKVAEALYRSMGFGESDIGWDGETVLLYRM